MLQYHVQASKNDDSLFTFALGAFIKDPIVVMLFRKETLDQILTGQVTCAFRKWKRPTVKAGGKLTTRIGVLHISAVDQIAMSAITSDDLKNAGLTLAELKKYVSGREGSLYRIAFHYHGEDPRVALRDAKDLTQSEIAEISSRLDGYDKRSNHGPWAYTVLGLIDQYPGEVSTALADTMGVERYWLKGNIRKLKALGLTISMGVGYTLSPRGKAYLRRIDSI